jgi:hypothetical protein
MASNTPKLLLYGRELATRFNLYQIRKYFAFDFEINIATENDLEMTNTAIKAFIIANREYFNLEDDILSAIEDHIIIVHKTIPDTGLKWHIDDCQIIKRKTAPEYNKECYIPLDEHKYLYFNTSNGKLPKYTLLFYSSTYDVDFKGGILVFGDGTQIKPVKGTGILFDSREVHMVTPVIEGIRQVTLIKIY